MAKGKLDIPMRFDALGTDAGYELVDIDSLEAHPDNPRVGDREAIIASLRQHGQYRTLTVNRSNRRVLTGNNTRAIMQEAGWTQVAVTWTEADEDEQRAILLVDNRSQDLGGYDRDQLRGLLAEMDGDRLPRTGYVATEVEAMRREMEAEREAAERMRQFIEPPDMGPEPPVPMPEPPADVQRLREVVCRVPAARYAQLLQEVGVLREAYGTTGIMYTLLEAVRRESRWLG